jgi:hypothetical protein
VAKLLILWSRLVCFLVYFLVFVLYEFFYGIIFSGAPSCMLRVTIFLVQNFACWPIIILRRDSCTVSFTRQQQIHLPSCILEEDFTFQRKQSATVSCNLQVNELFRRGSTYYEPDVVSLVIR